MIFGAGRLYGSHRIPGISGTWCQSKRRTLQYAAYSSRLGGEIMVVNIIT
jgi:hypothetical protein